MSRKAILLVNVGTPDSPQIRDVKTFLSEFLNDKRVITIPSILRRILVNGIIVPFRAKKSAGLYKELWTDQGSPLLYYSQELLKKVNSFLENEAKAFLGMRYGNPSIKKALDDIKAYNPDEIIVLPLYPQYASSTTESAFDAVKKELNLWEQVPKIRYIEQFYNHPLFIKVFSEQVRTYNLKEYDHFVFSYHGLPLSHLDKIHPKIKSENCNCDKEMPAHGALCYKAACYHTTRLLASELGLNNNQISVAFQSRFSKKWISPFADDIVKDLALDGKRNILIIAPSFVTDCLETIIEIEGEYKDLFISHGGENLTMVKSLNDSDSWAKSILNIIEIN